MVLAFECLLRTSKADRIKVGISRAMDCCGCSFQWSIHRIAAFCLIVCLTPAIADDHTLPISIRADGATVLLTVHAEGAQIYEPKTCS
jgi:hypothetical protein